MAYLITDDNTTADVCLTVTGGNVEQVFCDSAKGITAVIAESGNLINTLTKNVQLSADTLEELYYDWLAELIFLKDTFGLLPIEVIIKSFNKTECTLDADVSGDIIDSSRHLLKVDIKAVTFYRFSLKRHNSEWRGEAVLDL